MLMLGREINVPVDLIFPGPQPEDSDYDRYVSELVTQIQETHELARDKLKTSQALYKRDYDVKTFTKSYSVGDPVYILDTATPKGKCAKLRPKWKGPGLVVRKITGYLYKVKLRKKIETINHDRMKPCNDRDLPVWLSTERKKILEGEIVGNSAKTDSIFCLCRGPDNGEFMIQCNECKEWYHGSCVSVTREQAEAIDIYLCPDCF
jgi:ribosomal protein L21E